jgi:hypothetical protein
VTQTRIAASSAAMSIRSSAWWWSTPGRPTMVYEVRRRTGSTVTFRSQISWPPGIVTTRCSPSRRPAAADENGITSARVKRSR